MTMPNVPEISAVDLVKAAESGEQLQLLDIRAPHRLEAGYIDILPADRFFNVAGSRLAAMTDVSETGLDRTVPVAVVCAQGISSRGAAAYLNDLGYQASSLAGGMAAWMSTLVPRDLPAPSSVDALVQFDRMGKGSLAYLVAKDGKGLVIDPPRNLQPILDRAGALGVEIVAVADTHVHADYISGAPALSARAGIPYYLHPADHVFPYDGTPGQLDITPSEDGTEIEVGGATVLVRHTPGHTEGSVTYLIGDEAALTGDFLFVRSIGRPDLGGMAEQWVTQLWGSLVRARDEWPATTMIFPAHYASADERAPQRWVGAPLSEILATNEPVGITDEGEFTTWILERRSSFPEAYKRMKAINVGLVEVGPGEADELEVGKNECAVA